MKKVIDYIGKIEKDKLLHLICSWILSFAIGIIILMFSEYGHWECAGMGGIAAFCIGVLKETLDEFKGGELDFKDLIADAVGCLLGVLAVGF
jgi:hypothetical protein